jgi:hypothetical protein
MPAVYVLMMTVVGPFGQLFWSDPPATVPILPSFAVPRIGGGWLPNPSPPSEKYVLDSVAAGRLPGDVVVSRKLESVRLGPARQFGVVGKGRFWQLHYRCDVNGPSGPYTLYVDRAAIVRVP